jgi:RNA polymerase sigma-70 factor (ECF subfamily)
MNLRKTALPIRKLSVNEYAQTRCFTRRLSAGLGPDFLYERLRSFVEPGGIAMELMELPVGAGSQVDEDSLIRAGSQGDHQAVETLFRRYQRRLFQTAMRVLGNAADAEDVLQDAMLSAYRALSHFEGRSQFSSWLTRIVINAALMRKRALRGRTTESLDAEADSDEPPLSAQLVHHGRNPEQELERSETRELISRNVNDLSPALRAAFLLCEVQGYTAREAARMLGVTLAAMKARKWIARQKLAVALADCMNNTHVGSPVRMAPRPSSKSPRLYRSLQITGEARETA